MKIRTTLRGALLCATAFSMMLLTGCIDTDYDLGDIDMTVGVGGENINLPSDNTTQGICLDDVLDLGENNFLKVAEDGNYYIDVMDDNEFVAHMWVNQFTVPSRTYKGTYKINLGDFAPTSNMKKLQKADDDIEFNAPMVDLDFDYNYTASDITALEYIGVENGQLSISLSFANDLKKALSNIKEMSVNYHYGAALENLRRDAEFEKTSTRKAQAAALKAENEGKTSADWTAEPEEGDDTGDDTTEP